ncbi:MAG: AAA-like domain-containing protein [Synechococcales cyanobacterium C42_A2020_086]|nr:AAA-like domain-containing protein [Synechococcales cyanobacterium C42_A2020_086]
MNSDEALDQIERVLLLRSLSPIERFIFQQSWAGRNYHEMAQDCSYGSTYIKEIGSQLWQDLSKAVGTKVTKKNLHLVLPYYRGLSQTSAPIVDTGRERDNRTSTSSSVSLLPSSAPGLEFPSGPLALDSPLYIPRPPIEELALAEIQQPGAALRIRAPKKMGKSSLLTRLLAQITQHGYRTIYIDFQEAEENLFSSLHRLLRWFCLNVSRQLELSPRLDDYWDEGIGSKVSCKVYFDAYVLRQIDAPIVLALNEVNRIFEYSPIARDFLSMLRFWHEQTKQDSSWRKLRLVVAHSTEAYAPLTLNQSPFNVGLTLSLPPFTLAQVQMLAQRYELDWATGEAGIQRLLPLLNMVGGHPYLVNLAFYYLRRGEMTLEQLLQEAPTPTGIYSSYLREYLAMLREHFLLATALQQVVTSDGVHLDAIAAYKLESMGLIHLDRTLAKPSCDLYRLYFSKQLPAIFKILGSFDYEPEWRKAE